MDVVLDDNEKIQKVQPSGALRPGNSIVLGIRKVQPGAVFDPKMKNSAVGNSIDLGTGWNSY